MKEEAVMKCIADLKKRYDIRIYTPYKYFEGLSSPRQVRSRFWEIVRGRSTDYRKPESYSPFKTDRYRTTSKSQYTKAFESTYGHKSKSIREKASVTGIPYSILDTVFRKGKAAWRTGHRVGATEDQWGYARVHSFIMLGCTAFGADFSLLRKAVSQMKDADVKKWFSKRILCPKQTLDKPYYQKLNAIQFIKKNK